MTISLSCDTCGRNYQLKDEAAGRKIRCKDCESILTVPELNAGFDDDDPWDDSSSRSSKQDDFWNSDDDDWGDSSTSSGAYSAPSAYSLQSRGTAPSTTSSRPKKPKKKRPAGGSSGNAGALVGKIVGGLFVAIVVIGLIARVGGRSERWISEARFRGKSLSLPGHRLRSRCRGNRSKARNFKLVFQSLNL